MANDAICERCEGKGSYKASGFFHHTDSSKDGFYYDRVIRCGNCRGTGRVTTNQIFQSHVGKYYCDARNEMDLSLREAAKILGLTVLELNDIEHGRSATTEFRAG